MQIVGDAENWISTLTDAPKTNSNLLLVDSDLLPTAPAEAIAKLRQACPFPLVIVLISSRIARQHHNLDVNADVYISKHEPGERVIEFLRQAVSKVAARESAVSLPIPPAAFPETYTSPRKGEAQYSAARD